MISRLRMMGVLSSAALILGGVPAFSYADTTQDHPALAPTRDVVVTYRFQPGLKTSAPQKTVTVSFQANGNRLRIDPVEIPGVTILDRLAQRVTLISLQKKRYVQFMPMNGLKNPFMLDLHMTYHATGVEKVAGYSCRNWAIETPKGKAKACVTDDGVILSEEGVDSDGKSGRMEAISVSYHDLPLSTFEPPAGFSKFQPKPPSSQERQGQPAPAVPPQGGNEGKSHAVTQPPASNGSSSDGSKVHAN